MLKNYIKIALRNLFKNKIYSFINVLGLTIGIAAFLLIYLFIKNEMSYDNFHKDKERMYRIVRTSDRDGEARRIAYTSAPFADALYNDFPAEFSSLVRVYAGNGLVSYDDKNFREDKFYLADSNFFSFFSFPLLTGNAKIVLRNDCIVISEKIAKKYFGNDDPIGKVLTLDKAYKFKVTGIFAELNNNSHLNFDFVASISAFKNEKFFSSWWSNAFLTYAKLSPGVNPKQVEEKFPQFMEKYFGKDFEETGLKTGLALEPMQEIYFDNDMSYDPIEHGDKSVVYIFSVISFFILLIACINFMNLSTARSSKRAKEVGLRKVVGALRSGLITQFLGEALILTFISVLFAVSILELTVPIFENFWGKELSSSFDLSFILSLIGITLFVALAAGSYPAFIFSGFTPVKILKNQNSKNSKSLFRQILVIGQFSIAVVLIIGTFIILSQVNYVKNESLGFNKNQVVIVRVDSYEVYNNRETLKNELLTYPQIKNVSLMSGEPGGFVDVFSYKVENKEGSSYRMNGVITDIDYVKNLDLKIVSGRDFSKEFTSDMNEAVILNETAVKYLGWTNDEAVGKRLRNDFRDSTYRTVVGVVQDYHFKSLKDKIMPLVISTGDDERLFSIRLNTADISGALEVIKHVWEKAAPQYPFEYEFLDKSFDSLYKSYEKQIQIFTFFALLAIFIACLGLFGLASFTSEQRTKEIGIRKVLGSSVAGIVALVSKEFLKLVLISNLIAWPLAFFIMDEWLQDFAYRVDINFGLFVTSGLIVLIIAISTVSIQVVKTAMINPIKVLKYE